MLIWSERARPRRNDAVCTVLFETSVYFLKIRVAARKVQFFYFNVIANQFRLFYFLVSFVGEGHLKAIQRDKMFR